MDFCIGPDFSFSERYDRKRKWAETADNIAKIKDEEMGGWYN